MSEPTANKAPLKLDFNERADSQPRWLRDFQLDVDALWRYPDRSQLEQLMAADMSLAAGSVMLTNGGDESIELLYKHCKLNDQSLLVPEPCFSQYTHNQMVWQNDTTFTPAKDDLSIDVEALKANLQADQWLILTRPNNPTGEYLDDVVLVDLIEAAAAKNAKVFLDEAYVEFACETAPINYAAYDNLITMRTFSKAFGLAGARIGYIFGQPALVEKWRQIAMPFNVSRANLQLATAAWNARDEIKGYCQQIAKNRELVAAFLTDCSLKPCPSRGNFLLFETTLERKSLLGRAMAKADIQIKTELGGLPNAVRLTIPENMDRFMAVLQAVLKPELIAFDMDGVLIDTSQSYDQCIIESVKLLTEQMVTIQDVAAVRAQGGFNNDWVLTAELIKNQGAEVPYEQVVSTFQSLYLGSEGKPGLVEQEQDLLQQPLKAQLFGTHDDPKTAVVTGRPRQEALQGVKQLDIEPAFIVSADDVAQQKPDPEGLFKVMRNLTANSAWFCGDTVDDMQAGTAAGCICIGIGATTTAAKDNLYQAGADVVLDDINQLKTLL
ncbi:aminotransferase class I/II-fold pyridoxal phosphate-dependent enzyme [Marinicella sp. S1101]|uniref:aminotransferase class I/II-fold pyridoxal phosphate-dependent enzyme n=1 Tax=Marinicella marina TaxID=2996016 RepID=UPI0022608D41|nr:aminotransferase class I/II-fold pyridoxal phosphate-dependent enzyme [Marinicella marina]MCX7553275.1 aminotransferase class I/II-fold pyridoxal phosphate-dependent enzyme [Marinicella marina]MDJ1139007.1 aminotransferase class I/II-fold pyridoxal phosphate-dependent enzyme [Marinicella marina]